MRFNHGELNSPRVAPLHRCINLCTVAKSPSAPCSLLPAPCSLLPSSNC
ncbi:MAG: hypothetical protein F6K65_38830 [Moorea sp. SIO3C2]|nr:hypothetical protein [Moorena sp. SIO3C2]